MSSHHTKAFFLKHYRQQAGAMVRADAARLARLREFELRREVIRREVRLWMMARGFWAIAFLVAVAAASLVGIWYNVR